MLHTFSFISNIGNRRKVQDSNSNMHIKKKSLFALLLPCETNVFVSVFFIYCLQAMKP